MDCPVAARRPLFPCAAPWRHSHFGDGENSLLMLNADATATAEQILAQAAVMGITDVQVRAV